MIKQICLSLFISLNAFLASGYCTPIPIKFCGNLIVVSAVVDSRPGNFILDTGTSNILLNSRYFSGRPSDKLFVGITGDVQDMQVSEIDIQIGELKWRNIYSQIVSMNLIELKAGIPIHGLIGSNIFRKYSVHFDYKGKEIEIVKIDRKNRSVRLHKNPPSQTLAIKYKGGTPSIPITLNGISLRVLVDTGAEINLMDLKSSKRVVSDISQSRYHNIGGFGDEVKNRIVIPITDLSLGKIFLEQTEWTIVGSWDDLNYTLSGPKIQGVLGHELFSQMEVTIDFRQRLIHLWTYETDPPPTERLLSRYIDLE